MDFLEVVRRRRMVRNYSTGIEVPEEKIRRIVDAARRAPSAGFSQGQSFVVVSETALRYGLADIAKEASYASRGMDPWISSAPVHIVLCTSEAAYRSRYSEPDKAATSGARGRWAVPWWHFDAGACFMVMLLAAVNEGLGAGFLAFQTESRESVRRLLAIPEEVDPIGVVTVGKPAPDRRSASLRRGRKPVDEIIHWQRWTEGTIDVWC